MSPALRATLSRRARRERCPEKVSEKKNFCEPHQSRVSRELDFAIGTGMVYDRPPQFGHSPHAGGVYGN
jgi:hypothetical protein